MPETEGTRLVQHFVNSCVRACVFLRDCLYSWLRGESIEAGPVVKHIVCFTTVQ